MAIIAVVENDPSLYQTLADELPEHTLVQLFTKSVRDKIPPDAVLVIAGKPVTDAGELQDVAMPLLSVVYPVRLRELLYTIRERLQAKTPSASEELPLAGGVAFRLRDRMLTGMDGGEDIALTEKEGDLLAKLLQNNKEILTKERLLKDIWGYHEDSDTHTVETHIYRLRGKLKQADGAFDIVSAEDGGYRIKL